MAKNRATVHARSSHFSRCPESLVLPAREFFDAARRAPPYCLPARLAGSGQPPELATIRPTPYECIRCQINVAVLLPITTVSVMPSHVFLTWQVSNHRQ